MSIFNNDKGIVLITGLILMAIIAILATTAYLTTSNELQISKNYEVAKTAFFSAESGIEEARSRLNAPKGDSRWIDNETNTTKDWRGFIGTAANAAAHGYSSANTNHMLKASIQNDLNYTVVIRHKTETDSNVDVNSDGDKNDVLFWGDTDNNFSREINAIGIGKPIEILTAYSITNNAHKVIRVEIIANTPIPGFGGALYNNGNINSNGGQSSGFSKGTLNKADYAAGAYNPANKNPYGVGGYPSGMPDCNPLPDVYTTSAATPGSNEASDWSMGTSGGGPGSGMYQNQGQDLYPNITEIMQALRENATKVITNGEHPPLHTWPADEPEIYYCNGDWDGNNISGGFGILAIDGDFSHNGNLRWHGIIIASGDITIGGGGEQTVIGGVIGNGYSTINGNPQFQYDCNVINEIQTMAVYQISHWRDFE